MSDDMEARIAAYSAKVRALEAQKRQKADAWAAKFRADPRPHITLNVTQAVYAAYQQMSTRVADLHDAGTPDAELERLYQDGMRAVFGEPTATICSTAKWVSIIPEEQCYDQSPSGSAESA